MHLFINKKILLSPYTAMTLSLKSVLEEQNINVMGFIDKNQKGEHIYQAETLDSIDYDVILILSPNHFYSIYNDYIKVCSKDKLYKVELNNAEYKFLKDFDTQGYQFQYNPLEFTEQRERFVFISKGFISANNKFFYLYCYKKNIDCIMLTDNLEQLSELKKNSLPCELLETNEADYNIAIAKFIIFDQGNYTYLPTLHPCQKTIQLWHGVGLKKMAKNTNITYNYFISTSSWTNETNFKNIFSAHCFLDTGYPRNDILNPNYSEDELDLLFCDQKIYSFVKENENIVLYMPTHRENRVDLPLDLIALNESLKKLKIYFIVKLHPHVLEHYQNISVDNLSHILFHNANGDIYPILKHVDILISDYSSIVYDFLLLDKPIIFFNYDMKEYNKNMSFLFDYDEYSPGVQVKTQEELIATLKEQSDSYSKQRNKIKNQFFTKDFDSAQRLVGKIKDD